MSGFVIWVSDWDFADVLDECLGKGTGDEFMSQLDPIEEDSQYCPTVQKWATEKKLPVVFRAVRTADTGDHFEWELEFTNPTGRLLRTLQAKIGAETG